MPINPILEVKNLAVSFGGGAWPAVRGLDLDLAQGEVVGLVGESGSGKSITAYSLMGLLPYGARQDAGSILFMGQDLAQLEPKERRKLCGARMGLIFQEPLTALNPVYSIGEQVAEIFRIRAHKSRAVAKALAIELLGQVGLPNPAAAYASFPHRFSGGMRQRVVIAMALALGPELIIADEPTTALDPTIAAQIIRLIKNLASARGSAVLFITHNLRLLIGLATRILVMYHGLVVEELTDFTDLRHPYSQGLWRALPPEPGARQDRHLIPIPGQAPALAEKIPGCAFAPRCAEAQDICLTVSPSLKTLAPNRRVRCHLAC
ncbi:MAG: ABC transporter ATP-binding protein [Deltaproteobacteria bacterium]|jgi:oligopeptide/dipeptide ABC transporter ATP-binding protein|nr:ABC transporter ATP-binding protein [Deltaproteobacteria bacterium]